VQVIGASVDSVKANTKFAQDYELQFPLLCDTDYTVSAAFDVARPKVGVAKRSTFLIEPDGTVRRVWRGIHAKGHAAQVLAAALEIWSPVRQAG
jgi:thioredoxin-dependent peroxiredoxin